MATPVRFPSGVSTERIGTPLSNFPLPNPHKTLVYENDFFTYAAGDWTVVAGGAGSSAALTTGLGGKLLITTATSGTEALTGNLGFAFSPATSSANGLQFWFSCQFTQDATIAQPAYAIGAMKGTLSSYLSATDGVFFAKNTGAPVANTATSWRLIIKAAAGSTTSIDLGAVALPVSSATIKLSYYYNGKDMLYVYMNDVCIGSVGQGGTLGTGTAADLANLPANTIFLAPAMLNAFFTGTSLLTVDNILIACETSR
jgi:hypothetical protein